MDSAVLLNFCFALTSALCVLLLLYGAWLCLPIVHRKSPEETKDGIESETMVGLALASGLKQAGNEYEEGRLACERGDYPSAQAKLLLAASQGDAAAQEVLGFMYVLGPSVYPGISRDLNAAAWWFDRAARSGRPAARYMACAMARRGQGNRAGPVYCFDRIAQTGTPPGRQ